MAGRRLLGLGKVGRQLLRVLPAGSNGFFVVDPDEDRIESVREATVGGTVGDPADPDVLSSVERSVETVLVAGDDPESNRAVATTAREVFPEALLIAYAGESPTQQVRDAIATVADDVIEYGPTTAAGILADLGGEAGDRLYKLARILREIDGRLGVFMHDNPDPDAIASAIALRGLALHMKTEADACYFGDIAHQENRALVNLLDLRLTNLDPGEFDPDTYDAIALVDHSRPGVNDQLPESTPVDIVIDHHPPREPVSARFVDLRSDVGATSTLLADYYRRFGIAPGATVATALLYGIRVDTRDFGREITKADFEATASLLDWADVDLLERVENPSVSGDTLDTVGRAIRNRTQRGSVVITGVGRINNRDALAQAADQLLGMDGVNTSVVYGFADETVYISARTRGTDFDIGETMRQAFDQIGSAGGHTDMAGAQIPLGILGAVDEDEEEDLESIVSEVIEQRFFEVLGFNRVLPIPDVMGLSAEFDSEQPE